MFFCVLTALRFGVPSVMDQRSTPSGIPLRALSATKLLRPARRKIFFCARASSVAFFIPRYQHELSRARLRRLRIERP